MCHPNEASIIQASVKDEYKTPPYIEELVALEFTDIERAIYDDYGVGKGTTVSRRF